MAYDLSSEDDVKEYITNLGIEYRFSCYHEKRPDGCHLLGDYLEAIKRDFAKAASVYKLNCDEHQMGRSCHKYAAYNYIGKGCNPDRNKAFDYFLKGCKYNCAEACMFSGLILINENQNPREKDYLQGMKYLEKGCTGGNAEGCYQASGIYIKGSKYVQKNMEKAFEFSKKACSLNHMYACANLSMMYEKGEGTKVNKDLAKKFRQIVIDAKNQVTLEKGIRFGE